jgi:hypothetical protein
LYRPLAKAVSFNFKAEGSRPTTDIDNKETDGWTGYLSTKIIHTGEKEQQRLNNSHVFWFNNLESPFLFIRWILIIAAKYRREGRIFTSVLTRDGWHEIFLFDHDGWFLAPHSRKWATSPTKQLPVVFLMERRALYCLDLTTGFNHAWK